MARKLYLCVGSIDDPQSSLWKLWTQGDDFYAAQVAIWVPHKLSVHRSGKCRLAKISDGPRKAIEEWSIPPADERGTCQCFALLVPSVYVGPRRSFREQFGPKRADRAIWVDPAPLGWCTHIECIQTVEATTPQLPDGWTVLGSLPLRNGSTIWITRAARKMRPDEDAKWQQRVRDGVFNHTIAPGPPVLNDLTAPADARFVSLMAVPSDHPIPMLQEINLGHYNTPPPTVRRGRRPTVRPGSRGRRGH